MNLFLYSHSEEFMTQVLLGLLKRSEDWLCLPADDFAEHATLKEEISQTHSLRRWSYKGQAIADGECGLLLDRVFSFRNCGRLMKNPEFGCLEWEALFFHLRRSSRLHLSTVFHDEPGAWGLPLLRQWNWIAQTRDDLAVPRAEYPYQPDHSKLDASRVVVSSFFDRYQWRPTPTAGEGRRFGFERPRGHPVSVLATPTGCLPASPDQKLSPEILRIAPQICRDWKIWFAEILFFEDEDQLAFGMLNVQPSKIFSSERLAFFVKTELQKVLT